MDLAAGESTLSALLCAVENPRAVVVALHGAGTGADYFDGRAHPDVSLLTLGARLG
ncbi:alpha/beta hydrolase, partial [Streptomyces lunaelactis]|nr:alpha/beta hydrolase [Streptomyces lunaelactis]